MKVYRIKNNFVDYQYFLTQQQEDALKLITTSKSMLEAWKPPSVFIYEPLLLRGDFFDFGINSLILSPNATQVLRAPLEMAGELLPLPFNNEMFTLLNVMECINCLDYEYSIWPGEEKVGRIIKYIFLENKFSESDLFKIPETYKAETLVVDKENGEGFVHDLHVHNIKGFKLDLLWDSNQL